MSGNYLSPEKCKMIKAVRRELGLSTHAFSKELGVSQLELECLEYYGTNSSSESNIPCSFLTEKDVDGILMAIAGRFDSPLADFEMNNETFSCPSNSSLSLSSSNEEHTILFPFTISRQGIVDCIKDTIDFIKAARVDEAIQQIQHMVVPHVCFLLRIYSEYLKESDQKNELRKLVNSCEEMLDESED